MHTVKVRWPELTEKYSEVCLDLRPLLLVGGGLGAGGFFFRRWFGVVPLLPRFFLIALRVFLGFL